MSETNLWLSLNPEKNGMWVKRKSKSGAVAGWEILCKDQAYPPEDVEECGFSVFFE
jgi:hypothetical protein